MGENLTDDREATDDEGEMKLVGGPYGSVQEMLDKNSSPEFIEFFRRYQASDSAAQGRIQDAAELIGADKPTDASLWFILEYLRCNSDWERLSALASELDRIHAVDWDESRWATVEFIDNGDVE